MPDVREPRVGGGAASPSTRIKPRDQPPLCPGMRCAPKPEFIDMGHLRRQTTVSKKTHYRGLPHKHNLAVPMLRKWVVHQMDMVPRQKLGLGLGAVLPVGLEMGLEIGLQKWVG